MRRIPSWWNWLPKTPAELGQDWCRAFPIPRGPAESRMSSGTREHQGSKHDHSDRTTPGWWAGRQPWSKTTGWKHHAWGFGVLWALGCGEGATELGGRCQSQLWQWGQLKQKIWNSDPISVLRTPKPWSGWYVLTTSTVKGSNNLQLNLKKMQIFKNKHFGEVLPVIFVDQVQLHVVFGPDMPKLAWISVLWTVLGKERGV